jgi:uncharacterized protein (DUF1810 family)
VTDTSTISRFLEAQNAGHPSVYDRALAELRAGRKRSHWIWFVLPQLQGLGRSGMAQHYGINGVEEAKAYLEEPTLRSRLEEVIAVIAEQLQKPDQSLERLMGGNLDATKTISCLTLFEAAGLSSAAQLLSQFSHHCEKTQSQLSTPTAPPLARPQSETEEEI